MARNIDPGPGYRLLEHGESTNNLDEYLTASGRWCEVCGAGYTVRFGTYRRKIKTMNTVTVEGKSKLVKPSDMRVGQIGFRTGSLHDKGAWCIRSYQDRIVYLGDGGWDPVDTEDFMVEVLPVGAKITLEAGS